MILRALTFDSSALVSTQKKPRVATQDSEREHRGRGIATDLPNARAFLRWNRRRPSWSPRVSRRSGSLKKLGKTTLERAFELAESGTCSSVAEILGVLASEGFWVEQVTGPTLKTQLRSLIQNAKKK